MIQKAGEGCVSPAAAVEELPSDSAESEPPEDQVRSNGKACSLAGDSGTVEVVAQSLEETPEEPVSSKPFDLPVRKEPKLQEGDPSGEPDRVDGGRAVDWGSPQILEKYGSMDNMFEWSSQEEFDSSIEEEYFLESSTSVEASTGVSGKLSGTVKTPVPPFNVSSTTLPTRTATFQQWVSRATDACVLPGRGKAKDLPRLSRFQIEVQRKVAQEWCFDYPYVPEHIMEIIESSREAWEGELVWDYLHVPKPKRTPDSEVWVRFKDIHRKWRLGRAIHKDRVLVVKAGQNTHSYSISVRGPGDSRKRLPDPRYYL